MNVRFEMPQMSLWRIQGDFANVPHVHEEAYQFTFPLCGTCRFVHENKLYRLTGGEGLVQHPQELHEFKLGDRDEVMIVQVDAARLRGASRHGGPVDFALRQKFDAPAAVACLRRWSQTLFAWEPADRLAAEQLECEIVGYLFATLTGSHSESAASAQVPRRKPDAGDVHLARAVDYIHEHFAAEISLDTLAAVALQSRYHFVRSFKAAVRMTPYQYVLQLRLDEAKRLLLQTDMTVTEISFSLGFASTSQFYRLFVRSAGMTPEAYRKGQQSPLT